MPSTISNPFQTAGENENIVIYEDEHVKLMFWKGSSIQLLVTFGDLVTLADGDRFYAETPAKKSGYTTIGFMAKSGNWYPAKSMERAIDSARSILNFYSEKILYGGSMGGYAALKYSRSLEATLVISLCPQWSIDPAECLGHRTGYEKYFKPEMSGMGVTTADLAGKIYIFIDKKHKTDSYHANTLEKTRCVTNIFHIPNAGHHVTTVLAGTKNLEMLIKACLGNDLDAISIVAARARRASKMRVQLVLDKAANKHPILTSKIIQSGSIKDSISEDKLANYCESILLEIDRSRHPHIASFMAKTLLNRATGEVQKKSLKKVLDDAIALGRNTSRISIRTFHNTYLAFNAISNKVEHHKLNTVKERPELLYPLHLFTFLNLQILAALVGCEIYFFERTPNGNLKAIAITELQSMENLVVAQQSNAKTTLKVQNRYLCAERSIKVASDRIKISDWEQFTIISHQAQ